MTGLRKLSSQFDLGAYLKERFPPHMMSLSGNEYQIDHEECGDEKRRLWINVDKRLGWCYKCETAYDLFGLIRYVEDCSLTDAVRRVRDAVPKTASLDAIRRKLDTLIEMPEDEGEVAPPKRIDLPLGFRACAEEAEWPAYIERRLGSRRLAVKHGLGWCWMGHFANRMIIPITLHGQVVSFAARLMRKVKDGETDSRGEPVRPYLYPKKLDATQAGTGQLLFNYDRAREHRTVVLTEGSLDAIHVGDNAMALLGKSLSRAQLALLLDTNAEEVVLMLDGDGAGVAAVQGRTKKDGTWKHGIAGTLAPFYRVRVVSLPDEKDPDEFPRATLRKIIEAAPLYNPARSFRLRVLRGLGQQI